MKKSKIFLAIVLSFVMLISSGIFVFAETGNNNLYPNPQPDISTIMEQVLKYEDMNHYRYSDLPLNGSKINGNVSTFHGNYNEKGTEWLYTLVVNKEGMVSINLDTNDNLQKMAKLNLNVYMNDPRTASDTVVTNNAVQITLSDKPDYAYVQKNYVFYAYPGVYYFKITGENLIGSDYTLLDYSISATQDTYTEEYSHSMGDKNDPNYPDYLGDITLSEYLSVKSTIGMKNWVKPTEGGNISGGYKNGYDYFMFTAAKTGVIYTTLVNEKTTILDTFLEAYHTQSNSKVFIPKLTLMVRNPAGTAVLRTETLYGSEVLETFQVEAGVTYRVDISGSNHPMSYSLEMSYSQDQGDGSTTNTASPWAVEEINQSIEAGLKTNKMMMGDFKSYATREEFAELVMKLYAQLGGSSVSSEQNTFIDTNNTEIIKAKNAGIINGTSTTTFSPNNNLTREQLCVMILRTLDATGTSYNNETNFQKSYRDSDEISTWALDSVRVLNSYKIINGTGEGLAPQDTVTKEVAILMMYRAYNIFK